MNRYNDGPRGNFGGQRFGGGRAPVNVGDELNVTIEAVGEKGDGVAKKDGFVIFVPSTKEGETVKIKVTKVLRKMGFAEVVGDADGPVEEEQGSEEAEPEAEPEAEAEAEPEEEMEPGEDSEDFGEELDEEKKE